MERIKALQARLPREQRGSLNLLYMNALAELHNYGDRLGCDYRTMTPQERTACVRRLGKKGLRNRQTITVDGCPGAAADIVGASVLPHMVALELVDWIERLRETLPAKAFPILLTQDRESEQFSQLLGDIAAFYPELRLTCSLIQDF